MAVETDIAAPSDKELLTPTDNFMLITVPYDSKYVLPHKAGVALLAALQNAEAYLDPYDKPHAIKPLITDRAPGVKVISQKEYLALKMNALLDVETRETE